MPALVITESAREDRFNIVFLKGVDLKEMGDLIILDFYVYFWGKSLEIVVFFRFKRETTAFSFM